MSDYRAEQFPVPTPGRLRRELHLRRPPRWMVLGLIIVVVGTWVPLYLIYRERTTDSTLPKIHYIQDMDLQPGFRAQQANSLFDDGRAARQPVPGTVARGSLREDDHLYRGYRTVSIAGGEAVEFFATFPDSIPVDQRLIDRGRERYDIYCAVCHDEQGMGNGLVHQHALALKEAKWVPPTNLMTQEIRDRPDGQIFQAISDGVRNMPSYRTQINVRDRWAIVAWVRQLQKQTAVAISQPASNGSSSGGEANRE